MKKSKDKELYDKIKNVLIKKAEGYFYNEEVFEYQSNESDKNIKESKTSLISELENKDKKKNEKQSTKQKDNLTLSKKKVTSHYVPPDLLAVKMLVEIFGEKIESGSELEALDYDKLLELKNQLLNQLKEED